MLGALEQSQPFDWYNHSLRPNNLDHSKDLGGRARIRKINNGALQFARLGKPCTNFLHVRNEGIGYQKCDSVTLPRQSAPFLVRFECLCRQHAGGRNDVAVDISVEKMAKRQNLNGTKELNEMTASRC